MRAHSFIVCVCVFVCASLRHDLLTHIEGEPVNLHVCHLVSSIVRIAALQIQGGGYTQSIVALCVAGSNWCIMVYFLDAAPPAPSSLHPRFGAALLRMHPPSRTARHQQCDHGLPKLVPKPTHTQALTESLDTAFLPFLPIARDFTSETPDR